ncbi:MAG: transglycosylase SLT domain-containing protein [Candidatus Saganbacteria bacterium]|nr:transglycosylase SLT domain-containing protein [Candidatus Saganbacteria bacterium]
MVKTNAMRLKITAIILLLLFATPLFAQSAEGGSGAAAPDSTAIFARAVALRAAGSAEAALPLLRACAADEDFALRDYARFEIGKIYFDRGDDRPAAAEFKTFLNDFTDSLLAPQAALALGKSHFHLKNYPRAIKVFRDSIDKTPDAETAPEASYLIGLTAERQKNWAAAYLAYETTDLNYPLSSFGKQARLAIKRLKRSHRGKLPRFQASAHALFKQGMSYFDDGAYETATNVFGKLAREFPGSKYNGEAMLMLGRAEIQMNNPAAISDLEKAARGPANLAGRATYYLGLAYGRRGRYERAIKTLEKVPACYPGSGLCDDAIYWAAYYKELNGDLTGALNSYYEIITKYPRSQSVSAAIWRLGKVYYWGGDFKNAAAYFHLAQSAESYRPGADTPRCAFFEAKAEERLGNRTAALNIYDQLAKRFDHTYYAYRAKEKLKEAGRDVPEQPTFDGDEFSQALSNLDEKDQEGLAAVMEIWEQIRAGSTAVASSREVQAHLARYKALMDLGLSAYAAGEAKYLVDLTSDVEKDSAQTRLGELLVHSGEYKTPIKFADRKVKAAVIAGQPSAVPRKIWQLAYPKGYWNNVSAKAGALGLDPYLVLAVIREESRFNPRAVSRSGARGLMQIMPRTGRAIARDLDKSHYRTSKLFTPVLNIEMGIYYLSNLVKNFQGNVYLSLAGYNGGPNKVKKYVKNWYNDSLGLVDVDEFVESIPSRETRLYVQKVMGSYFEYKRLYSGKGG